MIVTHSILAGALAFAAPEPSEAAQVPAPELPEAETEPESEGDYAFSSPAPEPLAQSSPPHLRFGAGAQLMTRSEFINTRTSDGESTLQTVVPTRVRARLLAETRHLKLRAEFQDARNLADPLGPARAGFHQLSGTYEIDLARASLRLRVGRQEIGLATRHLFWPAYWGAAMRSWDALRLEAEFGERGGLDVFAGSLANPLLSSGLRLSDYVASNVNLTWLTRGYVHAHDALTIEMYLTGAHTRSGSEARNIVTDGLRLSGEAYPGLKYVVEGTVQIGEIERDRGKQRHLAGSAFAKAEYITPEGLGPEQRLKLGGVLGFDFVSGSKCDTTEVSGFAPCTSGTNRDYFSPWMARHAVFGHADRFLANNVIDGIAGLRLFHQATEDINLEFDVFNHLFAFPEPGGRWQNIGTGLIGVDPNNTNRWAADEIDVEATLRYAWLRIDAGWHVVHSLGGGRAISGVRSWQRVFFELTAEF